MLIMFLGVVAISPDAMFVRYMQAEAGTAAGADADLQITFWKYLLFSPMHLTVALVYYGGCGELVRRFRAGPGHIVAAGVCHMCISVSLNLAYTNTVAARAHVFFSLSPFWSALFSSWLFLNDIVPAHTTVAMFFASAAVLIVFLPTIAPSLGDGTVVAAAAAAVPVATLHGDLLAVFAGAALGGMIVVSASAKRRCPDAAMLASVLFGATGVVLMSSMW